MIYLIRHAQSTANAGEISDCHEGIGLSKTGKRQAKELAKRLTAEPDLIVLSPYDRTRHTAEPTLKKFPNAKVETWPVEEFHYLDANLCHNTTHEERLPLIENYFAKNDPDSIHGKGAESFNQMIKRVDKMLSLIKKNKGKTIYIFTHGNFIRATLMRTTNTPLTPKNLAKMQEIANTEIIKL